MVVPVLRYRSSIYFEGRGNPQKKFVSQVADASERGIEPSGSVKCGEFVD